MQWSLHNAALLSLVMASTSPLLGRVLLLATGAFQFTPLKRACSPAVPCASSRLEIGFSMPTHTHYLWFETKTRQEIIDITHQVAEQVRVSGVREGMVLVSAMHISASVFVNDHESGLWHDILQWLEGTIAPWDPTRYRHNETGEDITDKVGPKGGGRRREEKAEGDAPAPAAE